MQNITIGNAIINLRGAWDIAVDDYVYLDAVSHAGSLYVVVLKNMYVPAGAEPGVHSAWMLAAQGADNPTIETDNPTIGTIE